MTFKCEYCKKEFKRESSLAAHMCRNKKRYLQKNDREVLLGLKFFNDWHQLSLGTKKKKTYDDFMKSQYYGAFVRFGLYVFETRVLAPERYLQWLIKEKIKVDQWNKDSIYSRYLAEQTKNETVERALERFVLHAEKWSIRTGYDWRAYWLHIKPSTLIIDIKMGKISPWIFMSYSKAKELLNDLPNDMLNDVANTIDLNYWDRKISANQNDVKWIEDILNDN